MQKKNGPLAFDSDVSAELNKTLVFVMFGVELLLENLKDTKKVLNTSSNRKKDQQHGRRVQLGRSYL